MRNGLCISLCGAAALVLAACAANRPAATEFTGTRPVALTAAQSQVVESGVKKMVANPQGAALKSVTAVTVDQLPGIHVCGHVSAKGVDGKQGPDLPFYLELREADGKPVAERGQVGSDPSRLSKVKFMCRRNG